MPVTETDGKHTPGPWDGSGLRGESRVVRGPASEVVALLPYPPADGFGLVDDEEVAANARLIAAAPDMLAAARPFDLSDWLTTGVLESARSDGLEVKLSIEGTTYEATVTVGQLRALSAAIAKAEGRALSKSA